MTRVPAVAFRTLGCKVNRADAETSAADLLGRGVRLVAEDEAEVVVVTTCTVTGEADHKARKAVRHALGLPQEPVVVVSGCLASLDPEGLRAIGDRVVVEQDRNLVAQRVADLLSEGGSSHDGRMREASPVRTGRGFRTRAMVKVEDGCDAFCAYCIVPYARGVPRPTPLPAVIAEVERLVSAGCHEVVLTGINIGRYDWEGLRLPDLIETVALTGIERIRVSSIEPGDVDERFLAVASATPAFCGHLHIPLQSGSDATLAAMGRRYDTDRFRGVLAHVREALPKVAVTTDVLVGFPGERDEDARATLRFVEDAGFAKLHVFRYSRRAGTPAAERADQLPPAVIAERASSMRLLGDRLQEEHLRTWVGAEVEVLVESCGSQGVEGRARSGARVLLSDVPTPEPGMLVRARITSSATASLLGSARLAAGAEASL